MLLAGCRGANSSGSVDESFSCLPWCVVFHQSATLTLLQVAPPLPLPGKGLNLAASVSNTGTFEVSGNVAAEVDGQSVALTGQTGVTSLASNASTTLFLSIPGGVLAGSHTLRVHFDSAGATLAEATANVRAGAFPRYNEVWSIGTHNSYWWPAIPETGASGVGLPIIDQLLYAGVRALEIDVHRNDNVAHEFDVYHTDRHDNSQCYPLADCLTRLRTFHNVNPQHEVVTVSVELKELTLSDIFDGSHSPDDFDATLEAGLPGLIFTPDDLAKNCPGPTTMLEVTRNCGWPTVDSLRGKFIFTVHGSPLGGVDSDKNVAQAAYYARYGGGPRTRKAFYMTFAGDSPDAVFGQFEDENEPLATKLLNLNGIVRGTQLGNQADWDRQSARGIQLENTDHPETAPRTLSGALRCLTHSPGCSNLQLEFEPGWRTYLSAATGTNQYALAYFKQSSSDTTWQGVQSSTVASSAGCILAAAALDPNAPFIGLCRATPQNPMAYSNYVIFRRLQGGPVESGPGPATYGNFLRARFLTSPSQTCMQWSVAATQSSASTPDYGSTSLQCVPASLPYQGLAQFSGESMWMNVTRNGVTTRAGGFDGLAQVPGGAWFQDLSPPAS